MNYDNRVTTAVLLAAGTGSRLRPLTLDAPKCLTEVCGQTILGRLLDVLRSHEIRRLVVVTGYLDHCIRKFLDDNGGDLQIDYVFNPVYLTTNNIYSLWLARQAVREPFVLIESDLIVEESMLEEMLTPDRIAVSPILPWMNGATVELNADDAVTGFHLIGDDCQAQQYKTVNIYSLSLQSWNDTIEGLDRYMADRRVGEYYESVFAEMVEDGALALDAVFFEENRWHEIDTVTDLHRSELALVHTAQVIPVHPASQPATMVPGRTAADQKAAAA